MSRPWSRRVPIVRTAPVVTVAFSTASKAPQVDQWGRNPLRMIASGSVVVILKDDSRSRGSFNAIGCFGYHSTHSFWRGNVCIVFPVDAEFWSDEYMSLTVEWIESADKLSAEDLVRWNQLARNPLQRWEWLGSWWEAYQTQYTLCVLSVQRNGDIVAFVPWCVENRVGTGRTVQFLGSGKACTDHMSLLVRPEDMQEVCAAVAAFQMLRTCPRRSRCTYGLRCFDGTRLRFASDLVLVFFAIFSRFLKQHEASSDAT